MCAAQKRSRRATPSDPEEPRHENDEESALLEVHESSVACIFSHRLFSQLDNPQAEVSEELQLPEGSEESAVAAAGRLQYRHCLRGLPFSCFFLGRNSGHSPC